MQIAEISVRRPVFATVMSLLILLIGMVCFDRLTVREYPKIDEPVVTVSVRYPGASAEVVESQISKPLEDSIAGIDAVDVITSISRADQSQISVRFRLEKDADAAAAEVRDRTARVRNRLPTTIEEPVIAKVEADAFPVIWLAFSSDTLNPQETDNANNMTSAGAESMMAQANMNDPKYTNRFIGGTAPAGDVDFWKFDALVNEKISVACSSRRAGSGVNDFKVEILDSAQMVLQGETEKPTADIFWSDDGDTASKPGVKAKAGTYYLKVSSTTMVMGGATSSHYLCGVTTQSP